MSKPRVTFLIVWRNGFKIKSNQDDLIVIWPLKYQTHVSKSRVKNFQLYKLAMSFKRQWMDKDKII